MTSAKPKARATVALDPMCDGAPPPACGDGLCNGAENCASCLTDCGCEAGSECTRDLVCQRPCTLATETSACAPGDRCSPDSDSARNAIAPGDPLHCTAEGAAADGAACVDTRSCRAGLICHVPATGTHYVCAPPCGPGFPSCPTGQTCGQQGDGSGVGSYPTAVPACEPPR